MQELLRAIVYFNCVLDATDIMRRHPLRGEMLRDRVQPTRAAIHAWCVANNRVASLPFNVELLRAHLLPTHRAVVKQNGVFLLRPDRGDKKEIVWGPRFSGPRAVELGWHRGTEASSYIDVRCDVGDLRQVWYADEEGLHPLENLSQDQLLIREASLADYLWILDDEATEKGLRQEASDQALSDHVSRREAANQSFRRSKKTAIDATGRKVSKKELRSGLEENRREEARRLAQAMDPVTAEPVHSPKPSQERLSSPSLSVESALSLEEQALAAFRAKRNAK